MIKTKAVDKSLYANYLKKAEEFFSAMNSEFSKQSFNSCVLCAVHCAISSADALSVFFSGIRHAGEKHEDAVSLIESLPIEKTIIANKVRQLSALLGVKNSVEYEEKLTTENGAITALKNAERFFLWVKETLRKD